MQRCIDKRKHIEYNINALKNNCIRKGFRMFIRPKKQIQKSFRIDENVEKDLGILASLTDRSQNELANVALEEMLQDNKSYFLEIAILEHFLNQMDIGLEKFEPFKLGNVYVEVYYTKDNKVKVKYTRKEGENILDKSERVFDSDISDEFENYLRELAIHIDRESNDTTEYLKRRTDYRDYVRVRKK